MCANQGSAAPGRRGDSALITLYGCGTGADDVYGFTMTTNNSMSLEREEAPRTRRTSASAFVSGRRPHKSWSHQIQLKRGFKEAK